ncbi:uncharacterized protein LOC141714909 [Apium graveolens]|uniref:uncharacterized protein LOC141714909 n=1 Tax=Apium graveolens TaxID=4045 RepID=UPI003D79ABAE
MEGYHVNHHVATTYHPQTNGQAEVSNREIKRILEKVVSPSRKDWSFKLDDAIWAYRTIIKTHLGMSPFHLVYGKACHLPAELEHKAYWDLKKLNLDMEAAGEKRMFQLNELDEFWKLKSRWSGLFIVKTVFPYGAVEIFDKHPDQAFKINGQRLKHYYGLR